MNRELKISRALIRDYAKRSKKDFFEGTNLKTLYRDLKNLEDYLDCYKAVEHVRKCRGCGHWNSAPRSKKGWCVCGRGYTGPEEYCSKSIPRSEEQNKLDACIERKLRAR